MTRSIGRIKAKVLVRPASPQVTVAASRSVYRASGTAGWYSPVILGPGTLGEVATSASCIRQAMSIMERLEPDDYLQYLSAYYRAGLDRFGDVWRYADLGTVLLAAAQLLQPESYLEIGVRRGRSMAMVASACPRCSIIGFDMWMTDYAGMVNEGPDFVCAEMARLGHTGHLKLISGDSHRELPIFFKQSPNAFFDVITVDGDHSRCGAEQDLRDVLPRLKVGGILILDDICHPSHRYLEGVWRRVIVSDGRFATWQFTELGYGVAFAVRREG